ncbi:Uncharacterised protein [Zhongshania aliphaticivorans]|uniref:Uncharacterized protein n=1 Tax=Zhongshania aliphaticivorans TaxID=1470434 RepID=A0A5S9N5H6_9GAMM|nr:hypothetical protein [Zhongshania aliphaticivorans]CAA0081364.1 Uncharacterised protein [Zhongshania aliphaticivorans]CAA0085079.1 Uncharacterised protein [Zhongshania aliphaticivorans]
MKTRRQFFKYLSVGGIGAAIGVIVGKATVQSPEVLIVRGRVSQNAASKSLMVQKAAKMEVGQKIYCLGLNAVGDGYQGDFVVAAGDFSEQVSKDIAGAIFVPVADDLSATTKVLVRLYSGFPLLSWWKAGGYTFENVQSAMDYVSEGGLEILDARGEYVVGLQSALQARSNVTIMLSGGEINNSAAASPHYVGILLGQCNREDISRAAGVEETAHLAGVLGEGDSVISIGPRWNNTSEDWTSSANYMPQAGDLVVVCTTDNTSSDPARRIPSFTFHRKVTGVDGLDIIVDRPIDGGGEFMVVPMSRGLGYDRTTYGGVGRMEAVENFSIIGGKLSSDNGYAYYAGAIIGGVIECETEGKAGVFGNGIRETVFRQRSKFTRTAIEIAFGSEDADVQRLNASHFDVGDYYTVACVQLGELSRGTKFGNVEVAAQSWDGENGSGGYSSAVKLTGLGVRILGRLNVKVGTAGGKLLDFGASNWPLSLDGEKIKVSNAVSTSGLLVDSNENSAIKLKELDIFGETTNADAAIFRTNNSSIEKLKMSGNTRPVRVVGKCIIGESAIGGALVNATFNTVITSELLRGKIQRCRKVVGYAASYAPDENYKMNLSGDLELLEPVGSFVDGDMIGMILEQDVVGGRAVSFAVGSSYRAAPSIGAGLASQRLSMTFERLGSVWICIDTNGGWRS